MSGRIRRVGRALRSKHRGWLTGSREDHERFVEVNRRAARSAIFGVLVVHVFLVGSLTYGWPILVDLTVALVGITGTYRLADRYRVGEPAFMITGSFVLAATTVATMLSGGARSPFLPLMLTAAVPQAVAMRKSIARLFAGLTAASVAGVVVAGQIWPALEDAPAAPTYLFGLTAVTVLYRTTDCVLRLARSHASARSEAAVDVLTGAYNRRALSRHYGDLRERLTIRAAHLAAAEVVDDIDESCLQATYLLTVIAVDIDHFKRVNDERGHERGDLVLAGVAARMQHALRPSDLLYRVGGEEFMVMAAGAGGDALAERLREAIAASPVAGVEVTISAGVCFGDPLAAELPAMLAAADHALYLAKTNGRNQVCLVAAPA